MTSLLGCHFSVVDYFVPCEQGSWSVIVRQAKRALAFEANKWWLVVVMCERRRVVAQPEVLSVAGLKDPDLPIFLTT